MARLHREGALRPPAPRPRAIASPAPLISCAASRPSLTRMAAPAGLWGERDAREQELHLVHPGPAQLPGVQVRLIGPLFWWLRACAPPPPVPVERATGAGGGRAGCCCRGAGGASGGALVVPTVRGAATDEAGGGWAPVCASESRVACRGRASGAATGGGFPRSRGVITHVASLDRTQTSGRARRPRRHPPAPRPRRSAAAAPLPPHRPRRCPLRLRIPRRPLPRQRP